MRKRRAPRMSTTNKSLLTTIVSVAVIFTLMTALSVNLIFTNSLNILKEKDAEQARFLAQGIQDHFTHMTGLLNLTQQVLGSLDLTEGSARDMAERTLWLMMDANPHIYDAWFIFKKDVYLDGLYYIKEYLRHDGAIREVPRHEDGDGPEHNPWYAIPMATGEIYFDGVDLYDYETGEGAVYTATISVPVAVDGAIAGVCGIDVTYDCMFAALEETHHTMLLLSRGLSILYAQDAELISRNLADFGHEGIGGLRGAAEREESVSMAAQSPFSGEDALISLWPIPVDTGAGVLPLYVYAETLIGGLNASAGRVMALMIAAGAICLLLLIIIILLMINSYTRPIKRLTHEAQQMAKGNLDVTFSAVAPDEVGNQRNDLAVLQGSLMQMVENLKDSLNAVEQRVDERTYQLKLMTNAAEEAKDRAEEADIIKTQFLANMSHEIRTPMNAIIGMSELMLAEELTKHQRRYADDIKVSASSLLSIINDILDISKIQARKLNLMPTHYDFMALLDNINSIAGFLVQGKEVEYRFSLQGFAPKCLYGDDVRLRQILLNIIGNAVKFTEKGHVKLAVSVTEENIKFSISDTGIGIKEENLPILFEAFSQADQYRNRYKSGTGLGLSITRSLVGMMGGQVSVESVYGEGSVFRVLIPKVLGDEALIAPDEVAQIAVYAPDAKILVVDDNAINLNVACGLLRLCRIAADTALSGAQALVMAEKNAYDLIFMDHMMPGMDGIETTVALREKGVAVPIIALTANAIAGTKETFMSAGMNDLVVKPIEKALFHKVLEKWLPPDKLLSPPETDAAADDADIHDRFWDRLEQIRDISVTTGLDRVSGQRDVYESSLKYMLGEIKKGEEKLLSFLEAVDLDNFTITVHSLKSSLANIGAMDLSADAYELEIAAEKRDAVFCALNLPTFLMAMDKLHTELSAAFAIVKQGHGKRIDLPPGFPAILAALEQALDGMDFIAIDRGIMALDAEKPRGALKEAAGQIKDAVLVMEYDGAKTVIRQLLDQEE